jgi:hypothetical protein
MGLSAGQDISGEGSTYGGSTIVSAIFDMFNGLRNNSDWGWPHGWNSRAGMIRTSVADADRSVGI